MHDVEARLGAALADRYRIERELGAGGMATVNLAHDIKRDRKAPRFKVPAELLVPKSKYDTPWDVAKDGRFIMARVMQRPGYETGTTIVVEHWINELKAKVKK